MGKKNNCQLCREVLKEEIKRELIEGFLFNVIGQIMNDQDKKIRKIGQATVDTLMSIKKIIK